MFGIVIPLKFKLVWPAVKALEFAPAQCAARRATGIDAHIGEVSLKEAFVRLLAFGLVKVSVTVEIPLTRITEGRKTC